MSGKPAARIGDFHSCPMVTPPPHVGGPVCTSCGRTYIGGPLAARKGDSCVCNGPLDTISGGAPCVPIERKAAARQTDATAHGGAIVVGEGTVLIGLAGTAGNVFKGKIACEAMRAGRTGTNPVQQSYSNCGVESSRTLIQAATGSQITEDQLLTQAMTNGWATDSDLTSAVPVFNDGGAFPQQWQSIMGANGVPTTQLTSVTSPAFADAIANGQGSVIALDAAQLWPTTINFTPSSPAPHAVNVTGIEYDDGGNITAYYINDSGAGQCGQRVPANVFQNAVNGWEQTMTGGNPTYGPVVTTNPIW
ncbi:MAG: PAAR domain-containing protein [Sandaracinaceae bacterium]